jgi:hypothetical protein
MVVFSRIEPISLPSLEAIEVIESQTTVVCKQHLMHKIGGYHGLEVAKLDT